MGLATGGVEVAFRALNEGRARGLPAGLLRAGRAARGLSLEVGWLGAGGGGGGGAQWALLLGRDHIRQVG